MRITRFFLAALFAISIWGAGHYWIEGTSIGSAEASSKKLNRTSNFGSSSGKKKAPAKRATKRSSKKSTKRSTKKSSKKSRKGTRKSAGVAPTKHTSEGEALSCNAALARRAMKTCTKKNTSFNGRRNCISSALGKFAKNTRRLRSVLPRKSPAKISQIVKLASSVRKTKTPADATLLLTKAKDAFLATLELAQEQDPKGKKELEVNLDEINGVFDTALSAMEAAT